MHKMDDSPNHPYGILQDGMEVSTAGVRPLERLLVGKMTNTLEISLEMIYRRLLAMVSECMRSDYGLKSILGVSQALVIRQLELVAY